MNFDWFRGFNFFKNDYVITDHRKYAVWFHKTFEKPRRKKRK